MLKLESLCLKILILKPLLSAKLCD